MNLSELEKDITAEKVRKRASEILGIEEKEFKKGIELKMFDKAAEKVDERAQKLREKGIITESMEKFLKSGPKETKIVKFKRFLDRMS